MRSSSLKYDTVIFDLDGTLLDTGEGVVDAVKETVVHYGLKQLSDEEYRLFNGPPMKKSLMKWFGLDEETAVQATQYFRACYLNSHLLKARKYPDEDEVLEQLKQKGVKLAVATYKQTNCAQAILEHFDLAKYFNVINGDTPNSSHSKADIIRLALEALGGDCKKAVMIGDMVSDYESANSVGINFIGVTYGYGYKMDDSTVDITFCPNMLDLLKYL